MHTYVYLFQFSLLNVIVNGLLRSAEALPQHLCLEDDYTNDLPFFIEKRAICNYETGPVPVYLIKIMPDNDDELKFCLKGELADAFRITNENELKLFGRLEQPETDLRVQIIRTSKDVIGSVGGRRQAVNALQFFLIIEDCNQVTWQTIVVAVLSSVCITLMSSLAIMLILYQQKGLIHSNEAEEKPEDLPLGMDLRDESFINPRRSSPYEFKSINMHDDVNLDNIETSTV